MDPYATHAGGAGPGGAAGLAAPESLVRDGLARLNSSLHPRVEFLVDSDPHSRELPETHTITGTLVLRTPEGRGRSSSFPLLTSSARRRMLHSIAASFTECAMALGLGSGVYRRRESP